MNLRNFIPLCFLIAAFALPMLAQETTIEYGQPDELRGIAHIFIDTGVDVQQRKLIAKAIRKRLPNLNVVSRPEESAIHLRFSKIQAKDGQSEQYGTIVKLIGNNRVRILYSVKELFFSAVEQASMPTYSKDYAKPFLFAVEFVKAYKKANGNTL